MSRPASSSRLFLRGKIFYFRLRLKNPFPDFFNKAEIRISTGTPYRSVALKFSAAMEIFMQELLNRLSRGEAISNLSNANLKRLAREFYSEQIEIVNVLCLHTEFDDKELQNIDRQRNSLQSMIRSNKYVDIDSDVYNFVKNHCNDIEKGSFDYLKIANVIAKTKLDLNNIIESRAKLDFDTEEKILSKYELTDFSNIVSKSEFSESSDDISKDVCMQQYVGDNQLKRISIKEASELFINFLKNSGNWGEKGTLDESGRLKWLAFILGEDKILADIEYDDLIKFRDILRKMPDRRAIRKEYRDKTLDELLNMNIENVLANGTINSIKTTVSSFFEYCILKKFMNKNFAKKIGVKSKEKDKDKREKFENSEIKLICDSIAREAPNFKHDWQYWVFMLAMFSGARITEICQLHVHKDIEMIDGIWCLRYDMENSEEEGAIEKQIKTLSSIRVVPVHPKLIELGFIDFVLEKKKSKHAMLFNGITKINQKNLGDKPSIFVNNLIRNAGIVDKKKVFHSFRHNFKDQLYKSKVDIELKLRLCGHEYKESSCTNYDSDPDVHDLYTAICNIDFDYDFDSLNFYKLKKMERKRKMKNKF